MKTERHAAVKRMMNLFFFPQFILDELFPWRSLISIIRSLLKNTIKNIEKYETRL